jgi:hypothetical protein
MPKTKVSPVNPHTSETAFTALSWAGGFGLICIFVYSLRSGDVVVTVGVAASGLLTAVTSASVGGLLGFLFGIPRTLQDGDSQDAGVLRHENGAPSAYLPNTNLEQISDWLTKILVGVGLTQIAAISAWFASVSSVAAAGLGGSEAGRVVASTIIVFFAVCGFLFGFLWTRLFLPSALHDADFGSLEAKLKQTVEKVEEEKEARDRQARADADALSIVQRQLYPSAGAPDVSQKELDAAVDSASLPVKATIFNQAQTCRGKNWRDPSKKYAVERTIPVFRALIAADPNCWFHKNYGQLGFALKDKPVPDWEAAEAALSRAIEIRRKDQKDGWLFYEFCRAQSRIHLDSDFAAGFKSSPDLQERVMADLKTAADGGLRDIVLGDDVVDRWLKLNELTIP